MRHPEYFEVFSIAKSSYQQLGTVGANFEMCAIRWCAGGGRSSSPFSSYGRNKVGHHGFVID